MLVCEQDSLTTNIDLLQDLVKLMDPPISKRQVVGKPK